MSILTEKREVNALLLEADEAGIFLIESDEFLLAIRMHN